MKNKYKRFIDTYEKEIKQYRDAYYRNIIQYSNKTSKFPTISFYLIPILISIMSLIILDFQIIGYIISFLLIFITNYLLKLVTNLFNLEVANEYFEVLKKHNYLSIEDYEKKLKRIVIGPGGYYEYLLNELITKYQINENTRKLITTSGEEYFIWTNSKKDTILLLNTKTNKKPEIKSILISDVRYFRIDPQRKTIVVNTSKEDFFFKEECLTIINEIMKEKRLENIKSFTPATYIDDFEIYMHSIKSDENKLNQTKERKIITSVNTIVVCSIALIALVALSYFLNEYSTIINIICIAILCVISIKLRTALSIKINKTKLDTDYIQELNTNPECIERFEELKYILGISNAYDKIYSKEGAEYITWLANGYFHVFLNVIYFNVVYMSIKASDVIYYKKEGKTCEIKLKDKSLEFNSDAEAVFQKILPNKDYYWLKGYQNK